MINVYIEEDDLLLMLDERVSQWTDDEDTSELFHRMYEKQVYEGCFDGQTLDIKAIVDNDYVNWCSVLEEGDAYYDEVKLTFDENGVEECYSETDGKISCIEAEYNDKFLIRW